MISIYFIHIMGLRGHGFDEAMLCSLYNDFVGECMDPVITITSVTVKKKTITFI
jgi:hypothetical protein